MNRGRRAFENASRTPEGGFTFETIDIPVSTALVTKLEGLTKNANATVLDMQAQMNLAFNENQRRDINYVSPYSYWDSYINITYYPAILSFAKYNEKLAANKDSLRKEFSSENEKLQKMDRLHPMETNLFYWSHEG